MATKSAHIGGAARWRIQWSVLVLFALLLSGVEPLSLSADEPAYIVAGYVFLSRGIEALDIMAQRGYAPLLAALEAVLFYATDPDIPLETLIEWMCLRLRCIGSRSVARQCLFWTRLRC
ncbi:MAG: hypothetical protein JXR84_16750 [Anaerolineae bacterium]|nr:hypothetical protein [Anaerolineae bacterium]